MNAMERYVEVYAPEPRPGEKRKPARVNWASIGSVTPDKARQFAAAILSAADKADDLNKSGKPGVDAGGGR